MKQAFAIAGLLAGLALAQPASATALLADGITYTLNLDSISANGLTALLTLTISGENTASDTEGGVNAHRTGINSLAFNNPTGGTVTTGLMNGYVFHTGGLNSTGCNDSGNFFCFDNPNIPPTPASPDLSGTLTFTFNATSDTAGVWPSYAPDFKIDWVGTGQNNYDLVSQPIPVNDCRAGTCPTPTPFSVTPEPATWAMMLVGFGFVGAAMRRRKQQQAVRLTYA
jgi:hypothetical protein